MSRQPSDGARARGHVFLSYSRKDADFTRNLHDVLSKLGRKTWADWEGIPPSDKWMARIHAAIDEAEAVVFVMSPDSLASDICGKELDYAFAQHKRMIPVLHREPDRAVRKDLAELNWVMALTPEQLAEAAENIVLAVETDLEWVRAHTRLLVRSVEWDRRNRDASYTLRGGDLREFETWQAVGSEKEPRLTRLQSEYLLASRRATTRRQQLTWGGATVAVIVASVLGTLAVLQSQERARQAEIAGARRLLSQSEVLREAPADEQDQRKSGLRAAAQALATLDRVGAETADADRALRLSYARVDKWRDPFEAHDDWRPDNAAFSADGRQLVLYTALGEIVLLDIAASEVLAQCRRPLDDNTESRGSAQRQLAVASDARHVALRTSGGTNRMGPWIRLAVWDLEACEPIATRQLDEDDPADVEGIAFTADGTAVLYWGRGALGYWRFAADELNRLELPSDFRAFAPSPDGLRGVAATPPFPEDRKSRLRVYQLAPGDLEAEWVAPGSVQRLAWTPGGLLVAGRDDYAIMSPQGTLRGVYDLSPRYAGALSADGRLLAAMTDARTIEVHDLATRQRIASVVRQGEILDFAFTPGSDELVVVGDYGFDLDVLLIAETNAYARLLPREPAGTIAFASDGASLRANHGRGTTTWQLPDDTAFRRPVLMPEDQTIDLLPRPDDPEAPIDSAGQSVISEANGRAGRRAVLLCTGSTRAGCQRSLEIWDGESKRDALSFQPVLDSGQASFLQFAGNDDYLIIGTRSGLEIVDWRTLEPVGALFHADAVLAALTSGLGRAATMGPDRVIRVRNLTDNAEVARITSEDDVQALALSDDERWLAVLTAGGRAVDLYALDSRDLVNQACRWLDSPCP